MIADRLKAKEWSKKDFSGNGVILSRFSADMIADMLKAKDNGAKKIFQEMV